MDVASAKIPPPVFFEILSEITDVETFATGSSIRALTRLRKLYGKGRWRKRKGTAAVKLPMVRYEEPRFTGTKLPASAREN